MPKLSLLRMDIVGRDIGETGLLNELGDKHRSDFVHSLGFSVAPRAASSSSLCARDGLKTPQEQKRVRQLAAWAGVRRPSFTQSIIFFASEWLTMPCPHIVESIITFASGKLSVRPSNPSE